MTLLGTLLGKQLKKLKDWVNKKVDAICDNTQNPKATKQLITTIIVTVATILFGIGNGFVNKMFCAIIVLEACIIYRLLVKSMTKS